MREQVKKEDCKDVYHLTVLPFCIIHSSSCHIKPLMLLFIIVVLFFQNESLLTLPFLLWLCPDVSRISYFVCVIQLLFMFRVIDDPSSLSSLFGYFCSVLCFPLSFSHSHHTPPLRLHICHLKFIFWNWKYCVCPSQWLKLTVLQRIEVLSRQIPVSLGGSIPVWARLIPIAVNWKRYYLPSGDTFSVAWSQVCLKAWSKSVIDGLESL